MMPAPLETILDLRVELQMGNSLTVALRNIASRRPNPFTQELLAWLKRIEAGQSTDQILPLLRQLNQTPLRKAFVNALQRGLKGAPLDEALTDMESEMFLAAETSFEREMQLLPIRLLLPLTLFILPAVIALVAGPLLFSLKGAL